ncbi:ROK family protein [Streptomyces tricolor]|nr:ROK family protein [Streptomyces tricolor]
MTCATRCRRRRTPSSASPSEPPLDHHSGIVYASAPLWGEHSEPYDLRAALASRRPDVRWHIVNDVTAALLHAAAASSRSGHRKVLLATISSGIACRVIDQRQGRIPVDGCGLQGEIGHLPAVAELAGAPVALDCDCGKTGHLAAYASGPGIARLARVLEQREPGRWAASRLGLLTADGLGFEAALRRALDERDELARELLDAATAPVAAVPAHRAVPRPRDRRGGPDRRRRTRPRPPLPTGPDGTPHPAGALPDQRTHPRLAGAAHHRHRPRGGRQSGGRRDRGLCRSAGMSAAEHLPAHQALVREAGGVRLRLRPTHPPAPGELLVATQVAGLCGTDIQMLRGLRDDPAPVIGHEGIAHVVAAGGRCPGRVPAGHAGRGQPDAPHGPVLPARTQRRRPVAGAHPHSRDSRARRPRRTAGPVARRRARHPDRAAGGRPVRPSPCWPPHAPAPWWCTATERSDSSPYAPPGAGSGPAYASSSSTTPPPDWSGAPGIPCPACGRCSPGSGARYRRAAGSGARRHRSAGEPVAALLATPRDGTLDALGSALRLGGGELTVDLFGGLPPGAASPLLPGVDLAAVRSANCAGEPVPAAFTQVTTAQGRRVRLTGHRGVGNGHLAEAAAELCRAPATYRDLVTHVVGLPEAARIMNDLSVGRKRTVAGSRLIKLAVRLAPVPPSPLETQ